MSWSKLRMMSAAAALVAGTAFAAYAQTGTVTGPVGGALPAGPGMTTAPAADPNGTYGSSIAPPAVPYAGYGGAGTVTGPTEGTGSNAYETGNGTSGHPPGR